MQGSTHLIAGAATGLAVAHYTGLHEPQVIALTTAAAAIAALVPDWIQVNVPGLNKTIKGAFGHRGFSHWGLTNLAVWYGVKQFAATANVPLALAVAAGWGSHLFLDALNKPGVPLLWPLPWRLKLASIKSGGEGDRVVAWLCGLLGAGHFVEISVGLSAAIAMADDLFWEILPWTF